MKPNTRRKDQLRKAAITTEISAVTYKELLKEADRLLIPNAAALDTKSLAREIALARYRKESQRYAAR